MEDRILFTLSEISKKYGIPLSTLRRWAAERKFPLYKISNRVRVSVKEWEEWIEKSHYKQNELSFSSKNNLEVK